MKRSLHILADLYECEGDGRYFTGKNRVRSKALKLIRRAGFAIVASRFHKFTPLQPGRHTFQGGEKRKIRKAHRNRRTLGRVVTGFTANPHGESGITGVVIVSESHLTIHTWPERKYVNLDVFFCNYSRDNSKKARAVFGEFKKIYRPRRMKLREVWRD